MRQVASPTGFELTETSIAHLEQSNEPLSSPPLFEAGDLLIAYLKKLGIDYVFGIPGGAIEPLYNALARSERAGGPRAITSRHENGAVFMADGYYRNSGKLGCVVQLPAQVPPMPSLVLLPRMKTTFPYSLSPPKLHKKILAAMHFKNPVTPESTRLVCMNTAHAITA